MKKMTFFLCFAGMIILSVTACKKDNEVNIDNNEILEEILESYTNNTVISTYKAMADNSIDFYNDCVNIETLGTDAAVVQATESWKATREHWEKSEAFLFGPANYNNLDPLIDTWPLDKDQLDQTLSRDDIMDIDPAFVRDNLGASLRGFHAAEYIIFRDGSARSATDISQEEIKFLVAVAAVLRDDCITLEASWAGVNNISEEKQLLLEASEIEISSVFGDEMKNAGQAGSRYASLQLAVNELIQGCMDIADEVGNAKIAEPAQSGNVLDVESWYSWNSLTDFKNNIRSIENAYLGGISGNRGKSISDFVVLYNENLDAQIKSLITETIEKIDAIGEPFRNNLGNTDKINEAIASCSNLMNSLSQINDLL